MYNGEQRLPDPPRQANTKLQGLTCGATATTVLLRNPPVAVSSLCHEKRMVSTLTVSPCRVDELAADFSEDHQVLQGHA